MYLKDMGLQVSNNTLKNGLKMGKRYLSNLINMLSDKVLEKIVIFFYEEGSRGRMVLMDFLGNRK